jgi:hypothetical protein
VDDQATTAQEESLLAVWTGKKGGPVADLVQLVGEVAGVERALITFGVEGGKGSFKIGSTIEAELTLFVGATGQPTALHESVFTTIPGSPA